MSNKYAFNSRFIFENGPLSIFLFFLSQLIDFERFINYLLRYFDAIQNLIDNIFRRNIFRFRFIRQADAMP